MSPEERDELMQFILQSQSDAAERHRAMAAEQAKRDREMAAERAERNRESAERNRELDERLGKMIGQQDETRKRMQQNTMQIEALVGASHDLVEVARIHSRRLDRLEGLTG